MKRTPLMLSAVVASSLAVVASATTAEAASRPATARSILNGKRVSLRGPGRDNAKKFMRACRSYGAVLVLGPGDSGHDTHVHCQW